VQPIRPPLVRHRQHSFGSYFDISFQTGNKLTDVYIAHLKTFEARRKSAIPASNSSHKQSMCAPPDCGATRS